MFKNKKKEEHMNRLSFITQFKIEFLLSFTGCRNVLGKMLDWVKYFYKWDFLICLFPAYEINVI